MPKQNPSHRHYLRLRPTCAPERNLIIESTDPGHNEKELQVTEENTSECHGYLHHRFLCSFNQHMIILPGMLSI